MARVSKDASWLHGSRRRYAAPHHEVNQQHRGVAITASAFQAGKSDVTRPVEGLIPCLVQRWKRSCVVSTVKSHFDPKRTFQYILHGLLASCSDHGSKVNWKNGILRYQAAAHLRWQKLRPVRQLLPPKHSTGFACKP